MSDTAGTQESEFQVERVSKLGRRMSSNDPYVLYFTPCGDAEMELLIPPWAPPNE